MLLWFAASIVCLVALLAIPVDLVFDVERRASFRGEVRFAWLFGMVRIPIPAKWGKPRPARPRKLEPKTRMLKRFSKVVQRSAFRKCIWRLVAGLLRSLRVRETRLHLWIGLDDPADMGMLCAWVVPGLSILRRYTHADLLLYPDFEDERFEALGHGEIRTIPLAVVAVVVLFALSPATWRAGWTMVRPSRA